MRWIHTLICLYWRLGWSFPRLEVPDWHPFWKSFVCNSCRGVSCTAPRLFILNGLGVSRDGSTTSGHQARGSHSLHLQTFNDLQRVRSVGLVPRRKSRHDNNPAVSEVDCLSPPQLRSCLSFEKGARQNRRVARGPLRATIATSSPRTTSTLPQDPNSNSRMSNPPADSRLRRTRARALGLGRVHSVDQATGLCHLRNSVLSSPAHETFKLSPVRTLQHEIESIQTNVNDILIS
jgi:hypothetical protein